MRWFLQDREHESGAFLLHCTLRQNYKLAHNKAAEAVFVESRPSQEPDSPAGLQAETALPLSDRDSEVMQRIEQEGLTGFSFDGLRRLTGAHPETLSRILERLEEAGMIEKTPSGYVVGDKLRGKVPLSVEDSGVTRVPLLHTLLPFDVPTSLVVDALKGKWFDRLRWVGLSQGEDGATLKWLTEDGKVQIDATISRGQLNMEAKVKEGTDIGSAVKAAHTLMSRISRLYVGSRTRGRLMFALASAPRHPVAM